MTSLKLLSAGFATRVVDLGRPRTRSLGVPHGGAADRVSLMLGNALVGNPPCTPGLEISGAGTDPQGRRRPGLRTAQSAVRCRRRGRGRGRGAKAAPNATFTLRSGQELRIGGTPVGIRAYFCVRGGLQVPQALGSFSGLATLAEGAVLACQAGAMKRRFLPAGVFESWNQTGPLRVLPGSQASWFDQAEFLGQEFAVGSASDRMGVRLKAQPLTFPPGEITSEPVCPGTVQVTRDGQCIILGIDGQTIGGYPKIAQVIAADLDRLGQMRPGQRLRFAMIQLPESLGLWQERQQALAQWILRLRVTS